MTDRLHYVGPIGGLVALPDVEAPIDVPLNRYGGGGRTLMGQEWRDTISRAHSWSWKWENLLARQVAHVDLLANGAVRGPLRLIDPRKANRLPKRVSAGGSLDRSASSFAATIGGLYYRDLMTVPPSIATLPASRGLRGCIEWQRPQGGAGTLYIPGDGYDGTWRLPLLDPADRAEDIEWWCWVAGPIGVTVEAQWTEYEITEVAHPYLSPQTADNAALSPAVWQRITVLTSPWARPSSVSWTPRLVVPDGSPPGSIYTTAWVAGPPGAEDEDPATQVLCDIPELLGGFRIGGGAPKVIADPGGSAYGHPGFYDTALTLTETL